MSEDLHKKIPVYGELVSGVPSGSVTTADQIRDPGMDNMTQAEINQIQKNRKTYDYYPKFSDFPLAGLSDVLYFETEKGLTWGYISGSWVQLTDNFNSLEMIQGEIE